MEEKPLTYEIVDSIERIPRGEWDAVCGDLPEGYDFHRAIELAAPPGFSFFYALVADRRRLLAVAPLFICDFELDIPLAGAAGALIRRVRKNVRRFCVARTLFCGSPFGERGLIGVRPGVADRDAVVGEILRAMDGFSQALLEDYRDRLDDQGKNYLERVRNASQRMGHLIDDLLKLSRITRAERRQSFVNTVPSLSISSSARPEPRTSTTADAAPAPATS